MTCSGVKFLECKLAKNCKCYRAVMKAYIQMSEDRDLPKTAALEAAQRVYSFHRPFEDPLAALVTVERWINQDHIQ